MNQYQYEIKHDDGFKFDPFCEDEFMINLFEGASGQEYDFSNVVSFAEPSIGTILPLDHDYLCMKAFEGKVKPSTLSVINSDANSSSDHNSTPSVTKTETLESEKVVEGVSETEPIKDLQKLTTKKRKRQTKICAPRRRRKDIVFKSLLRRCRKYFQGNFDEFWDYTKVKKRRNSGYFYEQVLKYVNENFENEGSSHVAFWMAALINPKDAKDKFLPEHLKITLEDKALKSSKIDEISDTLSKFTHNKMVSFFADKTLACFFKHYVSVAQDYIPKGFNDQLDLMMQIADK
jgi:hypothetical protein